MFRDYFLKNRGKMLPWVKDWTDPHNHLRNATNVQKLTWDEWFWFNPINYKIVLYSPPVLMTGFFVLLAKIAFNFNLNLFGGIMAIAAGLMARDVLKKYKNRARTKNMCMFDIYLRDWVVGGKP